jgi:hypothetical protein
MLSDQELNEVRAMTIGELLDMFQAVATSEDWEAMEKVLGLILARATEFYDDYDDRIGEFALALGLNVVKANGIDKDTASDMIHNMGYSPTSC